MEKCSCISETKFVSTVIYYVITFTEKSNKLLLYYCLLYFKFRFFVSINVCSVYSVNIHRGPSRVVENGRWPIWGSKDARGFEGVQRSDRHTPVAASVAELHKKAG